MSEGSQRVESTMSTPNATHAAPHVQHSFEGDVNILNKTFDRRLAIRQDLANFANDLLKLENRPTQIKAEIKLRIGGSEAKEHSYTVTVTSSDFDAEAFALEVHPSDGKAIDVTPSASEVPSSSPGVSRAVNGQQAAPGHGTPLPDPRKAGSEDDILEIRPFKRLRSDGQSPRSSVANDKTTTAARPQSANPTDGLFSFIKDWRSEWVRQGGWLFDNITKSNTTSTNHSSALEKRLDLLQDVLGQSMNSASMSTMSELSNISKLIPWLEQCRKANADKVQAREEKWRSSSATFHDQARRDREAAEKRLERKIEDQKELLMRLARASGIDTDDIEARASKSPGESLGAQLTAELNMEAEKGYETININDD